MKKCRRCTKPATLHITEIHDGKAVAIHLCDTCGREYLDDKSDDPVSTPAADLAAKIEALVSEDSEQLQHQCSNCGISFNEFRERGRLGCAQCYDEFREELMPLLENIHEAVEHKGKRPVQNPGQTEEQTRLVRLRAQQRDAIGREDYEAAARLRDEIASIEATVMQGTQDSAED
ncbi:MAG: UvrB/UvrC motif-containing protein [Planctomycetaceae bacterium]|nr:UvrB/UvrC motif-containing protein [Planctomycetaceae bacterium]